MRSLLTASPVLALMRMLSSDVMQLWHSMCMLLSLLEYQPGTGCGSCRVGDDGKKVRVLVKTGEVLAN